MTLLNHWEKTPSILEAEYKTLLLLTAPFAPHIAEELWQSLGETESIHLQSWPTYDPTLVVEESRTIGIQINGKVRAEITVALTATADDIRTAVLAMPRIQELTDGMLIQQVIVVPGRIVNVVAA